MTTTDIATSLRIQGDLVSLGGLDGLLALAGVRVAALHRDRAHGWTASVEHAGRCADGSGATIALALATACEAL